MADIETVYRARIDYDLPTADDIIKVSDKAFLIVELFNRKDGHQVQLSESTGGPCWNAYFIIEGYDLKSVEHIANSIERYIKRFKNYKLYD